MNKEFVGLNPIREKENTKKIYTLQFDFDVIYNLDDFEDDEKEFYKKLIDLKIVRPYNKGECYRLPKGTEVILNEVTPFGKSFKLTDKRANDMPIYFGFYDGITGHEYDEDMDLLIEFKGSFKGQQATSRTQLYEIIENYYDEQEDKIDKGCKYALERLMKEEDEITAVVGNGNLHTIILD